MKEKKWCLYIHTVSKEIANKDYNMNYVGLTCLKPEKRWGNNGSGYQNQPLFWAAINKYGWNNIQHRIIATGLTQEEACHYEFQIIRFLKSNNPQFGYNMTAGGEGVVGYKYTETQRKNRGLQTKEHWADENIRKKIVDGIKQSHNTPEYKQKQSELIRASWTEERKRIFHQKFTGRPSHNPHPELSGNKPIVLLNTLEIFPSHKVACIKYNISAPSISSYCHHKCKCRKKDCNNKRLVWVDYDEYINMDSEMIKATIDKYQ